MNVIVGQPAQFPFWHCSPLCSCSESSKQLNLQRLKVLDAKQKMIKDVFAAAKAELKAKAKGPAYADLMAELLTQACSPTSTSM